MKKSSILFPGIITVHREIKLKNQIKICGSGTNEKAFMIARIVFFRILLVLLTGRYLHEIAHAFQTRSNKIEASTLCIIF